MPPLSGITYDTFVERRIVLDTNVIVAGLRSSLGASHQILSMVGTGRFVHVISVALAFEYEAAIKRPEARISLSPRALEDVLNYLCASGRHQPIYFLWRPTLPDPGDDLVLEVATHGQCDTIVTFNSRDFKGSEQFGIRAVRPQTFLQSLGATP